MHLPSPCTHSPTTPPSVKELRLGAHPFFSGDAASGGPCKNSLHGYWFVLGKDLPPRFTGLYDNESASNNS